MTSKMREQWRRTLSGAALLSVLLALAGGASGQSNNADAPTPVFAGEIAGRIAPLDLGDPRLTRHFYAFRAQPGDLEITVESENLEGDIDLFTATMRPLTKVTLYAGLNSRVTKTVFFRSADSLILRVQGRTPNDADGSYRIHLGGTFLAALPSAASDASPESAEARPSPSPRAPQPGVRRVNSVGARIEEPRTEAAAAPELTPPTSTEPTAPAPVRTPRGASARNRTSTNRRGAAGRAPSPAARPAAERAETTGGERASAEVPAAGSERTATTARTNRGRTRAPRPTSRATESRDGGAAPNAPRTSAPSRAEPAPAAGLELPGARLVLELADGERVVREMSEVRRVTVERGMIVIVRKSGEIERRPMASVLRMSIEP